VTSSRTLYLIFVSALTLSACAPRLSDCIRADVFCVGMVTGSGTIDEGINQQAWLGLQDAKGDGLADRIDVIETVDARDRAANVETLIKDGYDVIITVDPSMSGTTIVAAQQNPHTLFIGVEQTQKATLPNLAGLVFHEEQSGFLAGALAALITQTNRVAGACEAKFVDIMRRYCDGFQAGATFINPHVSVTITYREGPSNRLFNDPDWGSQTASGFVSAGADVLFAAGGETADAALNTASEGGAYVIGAETDQYVTLTNARPRLLSSALDDIRSGILDLMRQTRAAKFPAGNFFGQTRLAPFHDLERQVPETVKNELNAISQGLTNGSIISGVPYASP
jgi:basic membrane protein A and related proteins